MTGTPLEVMLRYMASDVLAGGAEYSGNSRANPQHDSGRHSLVADHVHWAHEH